MERLLLAPIFTDEPLFAGNGFLILPEQLYVTCGHVINNNRLDASTREFDIAIAGRMIRVRQIHNCHRSGNWIDRLPNVWQDFAVLKPVNRIEEPFLQSQPTYPAAFNMAPQRGDVLTTRPFYVSKGIAPEEATRPEQLVPYEITVRFSGTQTRLKYKVADVIDPKHSFFQCGMSGSPLFDQANRIIGLGMGRIHENALGEVGIVPIQSVLDYLATGNDTAPNPVVNEKNS